MAARALMLQGTGSDVGKSLLVAGLARALVRRGLAVRPFKPQNMSNNAAVTEDGGEIGRAQALQARACRVAPHSDMNPVLLKPQGDTGAQVVVQGRVLGSASARRYQDMKPSLLPRVLESFERLRARADLVLVEGAGSAAEVNLRVGDIANMGFAEAADLAVVLVGDVDRGGVIASLVGTHALLPEAERRRIKGFLVNKFRGDASLFAPAMTLIAERTGWAAVGLVPWFTQAGRLPAEDAVALERPRTAGEGVRIVVPRLSRIANFDDLDPLAAEPDVALSIVPPGRPLPPADLIILPGSKATIADLGFIREQGWDIDVLAHVRQGGQVLGICAGYQMLGRVVCDPDGIEGPPGEAAGLGLLDIETTMGGSKTLRAARGCDGGLEVRGYEMHMGVTEGPDTGRPMLTVEGRPEGAVSADGRVRGCYLHGLFAADGWRHAFLDALRPGRRPGPAYDAQVEQTLDALAEHVERHVAIDALLAMA